MRPSSPLVPHLAAAHTVGDLAAAARHSGMAISLPLQQLQHDGAQAVSESPDPSQVRTAALLWCCLQGYFYGVSAARAEGEAPARRGSVSQLVRRGSRKASMAAGALLKQLQVKSCSDEFMTLPRK